MKLFGAFFTLHVLFHIVVGETLPQSGGIRRAARHTSGEGGKGGKGSENPDTPRAKGKGSKSKACGPLPADAYYDDIQVIRDISGASYDSAVELAIRYVYDNTVCAESIAFYLIAFACIEDVPPGAPIPTVFDEALAFAETILDLNDLDEDTLLDFISKYNAGDIILESGRKLQATDSFKACTTALGDPCQDTVECEGDAKCINAPIASNLAWSATAEEGLGETIYSVSPASFQPTCRGGKQVGDSCTINADCNSGFCSDDAFGKACQDPNQASALLASDGDACLTTFDCASGQECGIRKTSVGTPFLVVECKELVDGLFGKELPSTHLPLNTGSLDPAGKERTTARQGGQTCSLIKNNCAAGLKCVNYADPSLVTYDCPRDADACTVTNEPAATPTCIGNKDDFDECASDYECSSGYCTKVQSSSPSRCARSINRCLDGDRSEFQGQSCKFQADCGCGAFSCCTKAINENELGCYSPCSSGPAPDFDIFP